MEQLGVGVVFVDPRGEVVECNEQAASLLGVRSEALLASNLSELRHLGLDVFDYDGVAGPSHEDVDRPLQGGLVVVQAQVSVGGHSETMYILGHRGAESSNGAERV
jgi:PAS domain-containing protein